MINEKVDIPSKKVDVPLEEAHLIEYGSYLLHAISILRLQKTPGCAITILQELSSAIETKIIEMVEEEEKEESSQPLIL